MEKAGKQEEYIQIRVPLTPRNTSFEKIVNKDYWLGYLWMLLFVFSFSLADILSKVLFLRHSELATLVFLFFRTIIQLICFGGLFKLNNPKYILIDCVPKEIIPYIVLRCLLAILSLYCVYQSIKDLPVTIASLVINMQPLFTTLFACIFLRERISIIEIFCLLISFYGVYILISSYNVDISSEEEESPQNINLLSLFILIGCPISIGLTNILLRYMKMLHPYTNAFYTVIFGVICFGAALLIMDMKFTVFQNFQPIDYFLLIMAALAGIASMTTKAKAMQYEMASRLSILSYLSVVLVFIVDVLMIGTSFDEGEIVGIIIVFIANLFSAFSVFKEKQKVDSKEANKVQSH